MLPRAEVDADVGDYDDADRPLQTPKRSDRDLEEFASAHALGHKLHMLQKGSILRHSDPHDELPGFTDLEVTVLRRDQTHQWQQPRLLYLTILTCSLGAIGQGWAQTSMNGANLFFPAALQVGSGSAPDIFAVGFINSAPYLGNGLWGSWLSEPLNSRVGRRGAIFAGSVLCLVASIGSAVSGHWVVLAGFRLLLGPGLGINASTVSVFAGEFAPASIRGGLGVSWQMFTAFGIFVGFAINAAVYDVGPESWRVQLAAPLVPPMLLLLAIYACPESPAWHVKKGRYDLAYRTLSRLRNLEVLAAKEVYASYLQRPSGAQSAYLTRIRQLFTVPRIRHATLASCVVMLSQQLCGINVIAF